MQAIGHAEGSQSATGSIDAWPDSYLSALHRDHPGLGCPTAALAGLMRDQAPEVRAAMAQKLSTQIDSLSQAIPGTGRAERRRAAVGSLSAMVGALILARSIDDPALSDELLAATRAWIDERNPPDEHAPAHRSHAA